MKNALLAIVVCALSYGSDNPSAVLARMDMAAPGFRSLTANVKREMLTAVINDTAVETGTVRILRSGKSLQMRIDFTKPDEKTVAFSGKKFEIYYPKIQTVQEWDLGKHRSLVDQVLLLGFGASGKELARNYNIKSLGAEQVGGVRTARLELLPKSGEARQHIEKVELWIAEPDAYPVRQKIYEPSGNTTTITYSNVKLNAPLGPADVLLGAPAGAKREYPQK